MSRDNDFDGKVIAITGGASGIGLATAQILFRRGATVAIADLDECALATARETLLNESSEQRETTAQRLSFTRVDVAKVEQVDAWVAGIVERWGKLDGAANSAGVIGKHHGTRMVEELEDEQWHLILGVNLTGMMYCLRAQLRAIQGPGSIVCLSSVQGVRGFAKHAAYSASKHGVLGLVKSAAQEVGARNVRVNAVTPGSIATPLMDKRNAVEGVGPVVIDTAIQRMGTSEETGNVIAWLLSSESTFVTGATYAVDGGWDC